MITNPSLTSPLRSPKWASINKSSLSKVLCTSNPSLVVTAILRASSVVPSLIFPSSRAVYLEPLFVWWHVTWPREDPAWCAVNMWAASNTRRSISKLLVVGDAPATLLNVGFTLVISIALQSTLVIEECRIRDWLILIITYSNVWQL